MSTAPVYFMSSYLECLEDKHPLQSRVRASGLQRHRRITLNFSDRLWVVLWGWWGVSLASLPVPIQHLIRCSWAMDPRVRISGSSCTASCPSSGEGADAAWQRTDSLTDTVWHLAPAPCSSQLFPQASQIWILAWSRGAHSVWQRGCNSGAAVLKWVMQHWCVEWRYGGCHREGGREGGALR